MPMIGFLALSFKEGDLMANGCLRCGGPFYSELDNEAGCKVLYCWYCGNAHYVGWRQHSEARVCATQFRYSVNFKTLIVQKLSEGVPVSALSRQYGVSTSSINEWVRQQRDTQQ